jgi:uncharacterized membrane protein/YHS domain-containing protein
MYDVVLMKLNFKILVTLSILLTTLSHLYARNIDPFNPMCPVYTDEPSEREIKVDHKGKPVYFCCKKCIRKFQESPEKFAKNIVYQQKRDDVGHDREHDHALHHGQGALSLLGKFHPAIIHFPIAGIFFAFFLQMLAHVKNNDELHQSIKLILILTTVFTFLAGVSGWINASGQGLDSPDIEGINLHRWFGISTSVSILLCTLLQRKDDHKNSLLYALYIGLLIISVILASITGHLGGILVFGEQYFQV